MLQKLGYDVRTFTSVEALLLADLLPRCSCIVIEQVTPGILGLAPLQQLVGHERTVPIVITSQTPNLSSCVHAIKEGAFDYLDLADPPQRLADAMAAATDEFYRRRAIVAQQRRLKRRFARLSDQERLVMDGLLNGKLLKNIAKELSVSMRTVQFRRASLMEKLRVKTRAELAATVLAWRNLSE